MSIQWLSTILLKPLLGSYFRRRQTKAYLSASFCPTAAFSSPMVSSVKDQHGVTFIVGMPSREAAARRYVRLKHLGKEA
jgi:hypothetical protein